MLPHESADNRDNADPAQNVPQSGERRRLLRGGLAAAPVLLTVASRPVLGQTTCLAASAMTSIAPSGNRAVSACSGLTPEQWKAIADQWPSPYCATTAGTSSATSTSSGTTSSGVTYAGGTSTGVTYAGGTSSGVTYPTAGTSSYQPVGQEPTKFHCPTTGLGGRVYGNRTMIEVIDLTQGGRNLNSLGRYIVAALLNARAGRTPVLSEAGVRMMWNDLVNRGYYEPTAGIRWTSAEIVAYLKTTMG